MRVKRQEKYPNRVKQHKQGKRAKYKLMMKLLRFVVLCLIANSE